MFILLKPKFPSNLFWLIMLTAFALPRHLDYLAMWTTVEISKLMLSPFCVIHDVYLMPFVFIVCLHPNENTTTKMPVPADAVLCD